MKEYIKINPSESIKTKPGFKENCYQIGDIYLVAKDWYIKNSDPSELRDIYFDKLKELMPPLFLSKVEFKDQLITIDTTSVLVGSEIIGKILNLTVDIFGQDKYWYFTVSAVDNIVIDIFFNKSLGLTSYSKVAEYE